MGWKLFQLAVVFAVIGLCVLITGVQPNQLSSAAFVLLGIGAAVLATKALTALSQYAVQRRNSAESRRQEPRIDRPEKPARK